MFVQLPDETKVAISGLILAVVNLLFMYAVSVVPWLKFFEQYKEEWAMAISAALILWLENVLPEAYPDAAILAVQLLVALGLIIVGKYLLKRNGVRGFQ